MVTPSRLSWHYEDIPRVNSHCHWLCLFGTATYHKYATESKGITIYWTLLVFFSIIQMGCHRVLLTVVIHNHRLCIVGSIMVCYFVEKLVSSLAERRDDLGDISFCGRVFAKCPVVVVTQVRPSYSLVEVVCFRLGFRLLFLLTLFIMRILLIQSPLTWQIGSVWLQYKVVNCTLADFKLLLSTYKVFD